MVLGSLGCMAVLAPPKEQLSGNLLATARICEVSALSDPPCGELLHDE